MDIMSNIFRESGEVAPISPLGASPRVPRVLTPAHVLHACSVYHASICGALHAPVLQAGRARCRRSSTSPRRSSPRSPSSSCAVRSPPANRTNARSPSVAPGPRQLELCPCVLCVCSAVRLSGEDDGRVARCDPRPQPDAWRRVPLLHREPHREAQLPAPVPRQATQALPGALRKVYRRHRLCWQRCAPSLHPSHAAAAHAASDGPILRRRTPHSPRALPVARAWPVLRRVARATRLRSSRGRGGRDCVGGRLSWRARPDGADGGARRADAQRRRTCTQLSQPREGEDEFGLQRREMARRL
jgi:hypothetical protein